MPGAVVTGWGCALPDRVVTNDDLARRLDTSDEWIRERTGIRERHIGGTTHDLACGAARAALGVAGREPGEIDLLVLATTTPDDIVPATASVVQDTLGTTGAAFDVNAACSGFVYSLVTAHSIIAAGARRALVIGAETLSRITDWNDRTLAVLVGDGAGAVVLEATSGDGALLGWDLGSDGSARNLLYCEWGHTMLMEGKELFRRAVKALVGSAKRAMDRARVSIADITLMVPHQANIRIVEAAAQRLGLEMARTSMVIDRVGNTSSASIPLALAAAADERRMRDGDLVLLSGFGAGMTWGSAVLRWGR